MDKTEIAIAGISGAELIKYYNMPDGVMGLIIIKGSRVYNISSGEKHFDSLEQAAVRAYISCPEAAADEFTRELLTGRSGAEISPPTGLYDGTDGTFEKTLPFEKDTVGAFCEMTEYYLHMIYERLGYSAMFPGELNGYRRRYSLGFRLNGERKTIPFSFNERGGCFEMVFGNVLKAQDSIKLSVKYSFGHILVTACVKCGRNIRIENTFDFFHKTEKLRIFDDTEIVYDGSSAAASSSSDIPEEIKMLCTCGSYELIKLPWARVYFSGLDKKSEMIVFQKNRYGEGGFLYQSGREYLSYEKNIVTDSMNAVHEIFCTDGKMNICTHFLPTDSFSKGIYKQKFENRYFYRSTDDIGGRE